MNQFNLKGLLEFTTCCAFLFAVGWGSDLVLNGIACAVVAVWALRISRTAPRWMFVNSVGAISALCFGLACLERGFQGGQMGSAEIVCLMSGCGLFAVIPLAGVNACLFLAEWLAQPRSRRPASP